MYKMSHQTVTHPAKIPTPSSWVEFRSDELTFIDWEALRMIALAERQIAHTSKNVDIVCELSTKCIQGGVHIVRELKFSDGDNWIARVRKVPASAESCQRLLHEVHTIGAIQQMSNIPVPRIITYRAGEDNPVGAAFTIQEYVHANNGMAWIGQDFSKATEMTAGWEEKYYGGMAEIQVTVLHSW
jgi:hypothetical protein